MKNFQIEFERKSYTTIWVEAETKEQAEALAWSQVERGADVSDTHWDITLIEEKP